MAEVVFDRELRTTILDELSAAVKTHFYDPTLGGIDWPAAIEKHRQTILDADTSADFESAVGKLLAELRTSHVGFYNQRPQRASARMAISATYSPEAIDGRDHWVFQVVHEGGPAARAGLKAGDILLSLDGREYQPPEHPVFPLGASCSVQVVSNEGKPVLRELSIPVVTQKKYQLPHVQPTLVVARRLQHDIGYIRISMFPGFVGVDVANEISLAVQQLSSVERMIVDLRGNSGGGLAIIRLMSLLTPERLPIGFSRRRIQAEMPLDMETLPVFSRVPRHKWILKWLMVKYGWRLLAAKYGIKVKPILLRTEGIEAQSFRQRVVLLVDRHTASACEIVAAFARENKLALLVGEPTAGRLLDGDEVKLSGDYRVALPVGTYLTARGWVLEGSPITPDVHVPFDSSAARNGGDPQLEKAVEVVSSL